MRKNGTLTDNEIDKILEKMCILVDSREKKNFHIINYFEENNIKFIDKCNLKTGDYGLMLLKSKYFNELNIKGLRIERKANIDEFAGNITGRKESIRNKEGKVVDQKKVDTRKRFVNEMNRAKEANQTLIIMFERNVIANKCLKCGELLECGEFCKCGNKTYISLFEDFNQEILRGGYISQLKPQSYYATVFSFKNSIQYNNKFEFVPKSDAGKFIYNTFKYYLRSRLKRYKKLDKNVLS